MDKEKLTSQFQQIVAVVGVDTAVLWDVEDGYPTRWKVYFINAPWASSDEHETFQHFIEALRKEVKRIESTQIVL